MIDLSFPWPPAELSPNWRGHWATKAKAAKKYKADCLWLCKSHKGAGAAAGHWGWEQVPIISLTFYPPDNRRRDADNCLASAKALLDAISEWIGIDDSKFAISFRKSDPVKNGEVRVLIA